jgi:hypothetical protein
MTMGYQNMGHASVKFIRSFPCSGDGYIASVIGQRLSYWICFKATYKLLVLYIRFKHSSPHLSFVAFESKAPDSFLDHRSLIHAFVTFSSNML